MYPSILGRILCREDCWKRQRLVEVIEYFASSLYYFRVSHWLWGHPSGILRAFISKGRMFSQLERLRPATDKREDHMISSDSFFNNGNRTKNGFNLLATRSSTRPALLDLGGTSSPFWKWGFKVPNMEPELLPFGFYTNLWRRPILSNSRTSDSDILLLHQPVDILAIVPSSILDLFFLGAISQSRVFARGLREGLLDFD